MRRSIATPCPVATGQNSILDNTYAEDTTANIEFTTAFHASFRNVRPKRGQIARRGPSNFAIHEDVEVVNVPEASRAAEQSLKLLHPARRVTSQKKQDEIVQAVAKQTVKVQPPGIAHNVTARRTANALSPPSAVISPVLEGLIEEKASSAEETHKPKAMRRKTLYIPSDDTTQPTMWMGIFSPIKYEIDQNGHVHNMSEDLTGIAVQMAEKRSRRLSVHNVKAKRIPLIHSTTVQGQASEVPDRAGAPTGKENLPPGQSRKPKTILSMTNEAPRKAQKPDRDLQRQNFLIQARIEQRSRSGKQSNPGSPEVCTLYEIGRNSSKTSAERPKRVAWNAGPRAVVKQEKSMKRLWDPEVRPQNEHKSSQPLPTIVPSRFVQPSLQKPIPYIPHAPIIDHIEHPELYEEDWLCHQEIAITQLLNSILSCAQGNDDQDSSRSKMRSRLLQAYNGQDVRMIYSRVQAAAQYGSLSPTHEAIFQIQNLVNDVGRRKLFLNFWIDNYEAEMLRNALEVVSGRQLDAYKQRRSSGNSPTKNLKRSQLANFIEAYILRHEDSHFKAAGSGTSNDIGGKTILKSLMLLKALDMSKDDGDRSSKCLLFRRAASFKSSLVAAQILMQMLNPAVGDSIRVLRQLGYVVSHQQEPMDELSCQIDNIAVDLRDGICLTRLVECLLYKSNTLRWGGTAQPENETITFTDGHILSLSGQEDHPLSQHLKVPCLSRATKMWNVQIALGALRNVKHIENLIEDILPEDIVDGYREKTIKLLWTIVGRCGLTGLIDRDDLRKEIVRLSRGTVSQNSFEEHHDYTNQQIESEDLVERWTEAVGRSRGLEVRNFTTSFSDGRIFEAILDEYEPYLVMNEASSKAPLNERLARLGCSKQFADLFTSNNGQTHIFGKDFVLAALAFLCSRVVGPSKLCRNATRIQRCWRQHWQEVQNTRRLVQRDLAQACAASVCLRSGQVAEDKALTLADMGDPTTAATEKTEIDEDIWLSL